MNATGADEFMDLLRRTNQLLRAVVIDRHVVGPFPDGHRTYGMSAPNAPSAFGLNQSAGHPRVAGLRITA